jgi:hypothetical protein
MDSFYYLPKELNNRNEEAMHATEEASYWFRAFGAEEAGGTVAEVETYEVYRARLMHPQP